MLSLCEDKGLKEDENGLNGLNGPRVAREDGLGGPRVARGIGFDGPSGPCDLEGKRSAQHPMLALQGTRGLT
jgi:hypothetical protein